MYQLTNQPTNQPTNQAADKPTVAVITSTIGRSELRRAIESVRRQRYPCKHYIFVDGQAYHSQAEAIVKEYPDVVVTYLPMNTGANGWTNSSINAIAPFLVKEDLICYLDDDNWYEENHIASGVNVLQSQKADYVYALRNFYDKQARFICWDTYESLGEIRCGWEVPPPVTISFEGREYRYEVNLNSRHHIDTNCYMMKSDLARLIAPAWYSGTRNDQHVYQTLVKLQLNGVCTEQFTVNYLLDVKKYSPTVYQFFQSPPFSCPPDKADELCKEVVKHMAQSSIDGWRKSGVITS